MNKVKDAIIHALGGYTMEDLTKRVKSPNWWLKGSCVYCLRSAVYDLEIGKSCEGLCEYHARALRDKMNEIVVGKNEESEK